MTIKEIQMGLYGAADLDAVALIRLFLDNS